MGWLFAAVLGWIMGLQAAAFALRLPGALMAFRKAPRAAALPAAAVSAALLAASIRGAPVGSAIALLAGALAVGVPLGLMVAALRPLRPDSRFLLPQDATTGLRSEVLLLPSEPDADAVLVLPPPTTACGVVAVVLHGGGNDRFFALWPLLEELIAHGVGALVANLPGHGMGGSDRFTLPACRSRVDALVHGARGRGHARVVLVGQSMGAALALDGALRGLPLAGAVAISVPLDLSRVRGAVREIGAFAHPAIYRALRFGTSLEVLPAFGPFRRKRFPVRVEPGQSYLEVFDSFLAELALRERSRAAPREGPPVCFVHGEEDAIAPAHAARETARALGPRAEVLLVKRAYHLDLLFRPEVVRAISAWVAHR